MQIDSPADLPLVSVILVSWNRRADLETAIASVRAQDYPPLEIVVVDNGSTDSTMEMLRAPSAGRLTLYRAPRNLGASVARNIGLRLARGRLVAFMDSDAELIERDTIRKLALRLAEDKKLAAAGPAIYLDSHRQEPWFFGGYYVRGLYCDQVRARAEHENPEYLSTCFSLWDKELVLKLGGFDPALPYGFEDNDLSHRALAAGRGLAVEMSAAVQHHLSSAARIRPESEGWNHFRYDERARCLLQLKRLGVFGFLKEEAWQWSRAGRRQRHFIYLHAPLRRGQKLRLFTSIPMRAAISAPLVFMRNRKPDWIKSAPFEEGRVENIGFK